MTEKTGNHAAPPLAKQWRNAPMGRGHVVWPAGLERLIAAARFLAFVWAGAFAQFCHGLLSLRPRPQHSEVA